ATISCGSNPTVQPCVVFLNWQQARIVIAADAPQYEMHHTHVAKDEKNRPATGETVSGQRKFRKERLYIGAVEQAFQLDLGPMPHNLALLMVHSNDHEGCCHLADRRHACVRAGSERRESEQG